VTWAAVVLAAGLLDPSTADTATAVMQLPPLAVVAMASAPAVPLPLIAPPSITASTSSAPSWSPLWPGWSVCTPCPVTLRSLLLAGVGHE
jgi:hypothetical protein